MNKTDNRIKTSEEDKDNVNSSTQEFVIRVPKNMKKRHHVMRFNATLNVDFAQWKNVKMERENSMSNAKFGTDDEPKFGAGSEYNRDVREEVRRKKYNISDKKNKPETQPWILKSGGKAGKKFRGIREGGVGENAAFYVFTHAPDGAIEAYPLNEWYNFQPIHRYKSLTAEEAEHEFGRRKKVLNYFSLMLRKRLKGEEEEAEDPEESKLKKGAKGKSKELKISDMEEWMDSDDMSSSDDDENESKEKKDDSDDDKKKKKKGKGKNVKDKKKKRDLDDEAFEESDDGDEEGRELDYISDSSDSDQDHETKANKELKSVAEEDALRKLLTSDEDSDEEEKKSDEENKEAADEKNKKENKEKDAKDGKDGKDKKKKKKKKKGKDEKKDTSSDFSSDSDSDAEAASSSKKKKKKDKDLPSMDISPPAQSQSNPVENNKRKAASLQSDFGMSDNSNSPISTPKKPKMENTPTFPSSFSGVSNSNSRDDYGITEEAVRRYLMRKPMTTTELLTKFKNKKTGVSSEKLVETMTQILKKINPVKQTIQGKMYLSIKAK